MNLLRRLLVRTPGPVRMTEETSSRTSASVRGVGGETSGRLTTPVEQACPYCAVVLDPPPLRKKRCTDCKQFIYVRKRPNGAERYLWREDQLPDLDAEGDLYEVFQSSGLSFDDTMARYAKQHGGRPEDILWAVRQEQFDVAWADKNWHALQLIQFQRAWQLYREGRDPVGELTWEREFELREHAERGRTKVKVMADECASCQELDGAIFSITDALATPRLPVRDCTASRGSSERGWCQCRYSAVS